MDSDKLKILHKMIDPFNMTKQILMVIDYQLIDTGTYKWKQFLFVAPSDWSNKDFIEIVPDLLKNSGVSEKVKIGAVYISDEYFDTDQVTRSMEDTSLAKTLFQYFNVIFFDPDY